MIRFYGLAAGVFAAAMLLQPAQSDNGKLQIVGQWSLTSTPGSEHLQLTLHWKSADHTLNSTMEWSIERLEGLSPAQLKSEGTPVRFRIMREAGALNCEGYLKNGGGGGVFTFVVSRSFVDSMAALGFTLSDEQAFAMAVHDVTTSYVKEMRAQGIKIDGVDKLLAMRIHDVTPGFARDLKARGYSASSDQLVAMRIHGVSIEGLGQLETLGYKSPSIDQLLAMRIHGVTPEYIRKLQARGMRNLSIDQLVSLRIHRIVD